jgi:hypothetical protein
MPIGQLFTMQIFKTQNTEKNQNTTLIITISIFSKKKKKHDKYLKF